MVRNLYKEKGTHQICRFHDRCSEGSSETRMLHHGVRSVCETE